MNRHDDIRQSCFIPDYKSIKKTIKAFDLSRLIMMSALYQVERSLFNCAFFMLKVAQLCQTLCNTMDYTVHGILQARVLEWPAFPFSRGSSQPRNQTRVSCTAGRFFTSWATRVALLEEEASIASRSRRREGCEKAQLQPGVTDQAGTVERSLRKRVRQG